MSTQAFGGGNETTTSPEGETTTTTTVPEDEGSAPEHLVQDLENQEKENES